MADDFWSSLFSTGKNAGGDFLSQLIQPAISALLGNTGRMSHEHFMEAEARADIDNSRSVARGSEFLKGLAPAQGEAYNTYQDATYGADTNRQVDRIQTMAGKLGMSPWELTGTGGSNPLPSPGPPAQAQQGQGSGQFLASQTALQTAKIAAQTQLATTKMQTDAALKTSGVNIQKGSLQHEQKLQVQAQTMLTDAQRALTSAQYSATEQGIFIGQLQLLLQALPETTIDLPGVRMTGKTGTSSILESLKGFVNSQDKDSDQAKALSQAIEGMPKNRRTQLFNEIQALAQGATELGKQGLNAGKNFLDQLF